MRRGETRISFLVVLAKRPLNVDQDCQTASFLASRECFCVMRALLPDDVETFCPESCQTGPTKARESATAVLRDGLRDGAWCARVRAAVLLSWDDTH